MPGTARRSWARSTSRLTATTLARRCVSLLRPIPCPPHAPSPPFAPRPTPHAPCQPFATRALRAHTRAPAGRLVRHAAVHPGPRRDAVSWRLHPRPDHSRGWPGRRGTDPTPVSGRVHRRSTHERTRAGIARMLERPTLSLPSSRPALFWPSSGSLSAVFRPSSGSFLALTPLPALIS